MRGVTQRTYNAYRKRLGKPLAPVKLISDTEVRDIYRHDYWEAAGCGRFPMPLAATVFDFAVNSGPSRAVRFLQEEVGTTSDGKWGIKSSTALMLAVTERGLPSVIFSYIDRREAFLRRLVRLAPGQKANLRGWMNRLGNLRAFVAQFTSMND